MSHLEQLGHCLFLKCINLNFFVSIVEHNCVFANIIPLGSELANRCILNKNTQIRLAWEYLLVSFQILKCSFSSGSSICTRATFQTKVKLVREPKYKAKKMWTQMKWSAVSLIIYLLALWALRQLTMEMLFSFFWSLMVNSAIEQCIAIGSPFVCWLGRHKNKAPNLAASPPLEPTRIHVNWIISVRRIEKAICLFTEKVLCLISYLFA